ncbi:hypothetical protein J8997_29395, partial [Klebsiella quasipneumoniae subsp. quasipneumoniae]|uniref:hypothetical protein n=1 Tax=Klebsiella quasipneumoniae TaxID=1463165 RepID=UPI002F9672E9
MALLINPKAILQLPDLSIRTFHCSCLGQLKGIHDRFDDTQSLFIRHFITDALRMTSRFEALGGEGLLEPVNLFLLIAHFANQSKALEADNKRLHETLNYMTMSEKAAPADGNKMSNEEALRIVETVVNTFELAQARAMEGANAQIREL